MTRYRPNVGIALFDARGHVFVGRARVPGSDPAEGRYEWEMPQGGIDEGEEIEAAARRELREETGIRSVRLLAVTEAWWSYEFDPGEVPPRLAAFAGQRQRWAAFRFEGGPHEIDIARPNGDDEPEFSAWRWTPLARVAEGVRPARKATYGLVAEAFARFAAAARP